MAVTKLRTRAFRAAKRLRTVLVGPKRHPPGVRKFQAQGIKARRKLARIGGIATKYRKEYVQESLKEGSAIKKMHRMAGVHIPTEYMNKRTGKAVKAYGQRFK